MTAPAQSFGTNTSNNTTEDSVNTETHLHPTPKSKVFTFGSRAVTPGAKQQVTVAPNDKIAQPQKSAAVTNRRLTQLYAAAPVASDEESTHTLDDAEENALVIALDRLLSKRGNTKAGDDEKVSLFDMLKESKVLPSSAVNADDIDLEDL